MWMKTTMEMGILNIRFSGHSECVFFRSGTPHEIPTVDGPSIVCTTTAATTTTLARDELIRIVPYLYLSFLGGLEVNFTTTPYSEKITFGCKRI